MKFIEFPCADLFGKILREKYKLQRVCVFLNPYAIITFTIFPRSSLDGESCPSLLLRK